MTTVGINLTAVNYWTAQAPFIDRFKTASNWGTGNAALDAQIKVDANGNPLGIPTGAPNVSVQIAVDPVPLGMTDRYVLTWTGNTTIAINRGKIISQTPGRAVIEATDSTAAVVAVILKTIDPKNPPKDFHLVREDQVDLFNKGEIFNPAFLEKASAWDTLRTMDWGSTNISADVTWDTRTKTTNYTWANNDGSKGVPIEVMVALANKTKTDLWYNVPTKADDTFVRNALTYIRDNLDPSLTAKVEYSNEVWNWGFKAAGYSQEQANALWGKDVNKDGKIDRANAAENYAPGWVQYYGYRSAQIAAIGNQVFAGQPDRLETVIATQTGAPGREKDIFAGVAKANLGTADALFDSYAVTTYFGGALMTAGGNANDRATVLGWARGGEAGMAAAFKEMEVGGALSAKDSLRDQVALYTYQNNVAQHYGLDLIAYEGGAHIAANMYPADIQPEITAFFTKLMNDPRMGGLYTKMVADFGANGGKNAVEFADVGLGSKNGHWGILDNIYQTSSPRFDALKAAAAAGKVAAATAPTPTPTAAPVVPAAVPVTPEPITKVVVPGVVKGGTAKNDTLVGTVGNDTLYGGAGSDRLEGGAGDDRFIADEGNDTLIGGAGADYFDAGRGADIFVINAGDSVLGNFDTIAGFDRTQGDRIDISSIDAIQGTAANDAFRFIGKALFSRKAGELRFEAGQGGWRVQGDTNGDGVADVYFAVTATGLIQNDFVL